MNYIKPEVAKGTGHQADSEIHTHPAFGVVTVTHPQGGNGVMFGSDVPHYGSMRIEVRTAELRRDLSRDWVYGKDHLVTFELTHAQWSEFISSVGNGRGTPCTLTFRESAGVLPGIERIRTKYETHKQEINAAAAKRLEKAANALREISEAVEAGKTGKGALRPLIEAAMREMDQLPGSIEFVLKQAEEALETATTDAKIEVESFISTTAHRLGFETMQDLAQAVNAQKKLT